MTNLPSKTQSFTDRAIALVEHAEGSYRAEWSECSNKTVDLARDADAAIERLRIAAEEVLRTYMPQFPDSRAVDDCLVGLAAALAFETGLKP